MTTEQVTENLTIGKKNIQVQLVEINQAILQFYPENPRVYSVLNNAGGEPTQEEIEQHMCSLEHVKQLRVSIESNGGLIDPLIVRDGDFTVLEGNSRLAAYRLLCSADPMKWGKVRCKLLPSDISDAAIFTLLGQYHIIGRKDWEPFEQAHYLYRRQQQTKVPVAFMAQELGLSKVRAEKMIEVIEFMISHDDLNKRHWSAYEEYLKNAQIKKFRSTSATIDDTIADAIKSDQIREAPDMRKLGEIAKIGDKQSKKIMQQIADRKMSLYDGYLEIQNSGKLDDVVKRLKMFRTAINDASFEKQLFSSEETLNQAQFEIKKILKRLDAISHKLEK